MALAKRLEIKLSASFLHQRKFVGSCLGVEHLVFCGKRREVERLSFNGSPVITDEPHLASRQVVGPRKITAASDRPGQRRRVERERFLNFIQQFERITTLTVHLVDERN